MSHQSQQAGTFYLHKLGGESVQVSSSVPVESINWADRSHEGQERIKRQCLAMCMEVQQVLACSQHSSLAGSSQQGDVGGGVGQQFQGSNLHDKHDGLHASSSSPLPEETTARDDEVFGYEEDFEPPTFPEQEEHTDNSEHNPPQLQTRPELAFSSPVDGILYRKYDPLFLDTGKGVVIMQDFDDMDPATASSGVQNSKSANMFRTGMMSLTSN